MNRHEGVGGYKEGMGMSGYKEGMGMSVYKEGMGMSGYVCVGMSGYRGVCG